MKRLAVYLFVLCGLYLAECGVKQRVKEEKQLVKPTLLHPLFFQEELVNNLNFPFWFDDSIISANGIMQITLTSMKGVPSDSIGPEGDVAFPKKTVVYTFNRSGQLIHIQITNFSEGIIIANQNYQLGPVNTFGYSKILLKDNAYGVEKTNTIYLPYSQSEHYLAYTTDDDESMLHFISEPNFYGPLSVDSIAHPLPSDWIVLGTPNRPEKRYHVVNKVKEKQVSLYTYFDKNYPDLVTNQEYPFFRKRYFTYSKKGEFSGFTDSTFIDETFVTSVVTRITYKNNLPVKILHNKAHKDGVGRFETYESLDYTFYE